MFRLTGCSPFLGDNDGETIQNVTLGEFDYPESDEDYDDISDNAKSFITKLLTLNPQLVWEGEDGEDGGAGVNMRETR